MRFHELGTGRLPPPLAARLATGNSCRVGVSYPIWQDHAVASVVSEKIKK